MKKQSIFRLKPTQFAVGMLEIDEKIELVRTFNQKKRRRYVDESPVPVVKSPQGDLYIVDHHHFLFVCYHVGIKKVRVEVIKDLSRSKMSYVEFWRWMFKNGRAYPFCQFGEGPRKALYLPRDIRGLADDPYRSLAWFVRKAGAFENSEKNFAEFQWANFFRSRRLLDREGHDGMAGALQKAIKLAQQPAASKLPGFGKLNIEGTEEAVRKGRAKAAKLKRRRSIR